VVLSGYEKCLSIPIGSSDDGELTNYQIKLTLVKGSGSNSGSTIYLENENLNWPYDVRFSTNEDGSALIDFWREEYDETDGTWYVEVPTIAASGTTYIYLHVGDADATDASDASATFYDYDGFEYSDALTNHGWSDGGTDTPDIVTSTDYAYGGSRSAKSAGERRWKYRSFSAIGTKTFYIRFYDPGGNTLSVINCDDGTYNITVGVQDGYATYYRYRIGSSWYTATVTRSVGWHSIEIVILSTGAKLYVDDVYQAINTNLTSVSTFWFGSLWDANKSDCIYWDNYIILNTVADEPEISAASWVGYTLFGGTWGMIS